MTTQYTRRLIIVVDADIAAQVNNHAKQVDRVGGERTFTVGLSQSGSLPETHYWCSWVMKPNEDTNIRERVAVLIAENRMRVFNGNTQTPDQVLSTLGLQRIRKNIS